MTIWVRFYTELKQTVLSSRYVKTIGVRRENGYLLLPGNWDQEPRFSRNFDVSFYLPL